MPSDDVKEALHIYDDDDMDDLIRKMYTLEDFYKERDEYRGFAPFIKVYREVTEDVNDLYATDQFNDPAMMEELDLYFAECYLKRMRSFILHGEKKSPWKTYIDYCTSDDRYESLTMVLGINAHINGDLLHAINHIGLEDEDDFTRINGILEEHLSENLHYLILQEHDRLALYAELAKPLTWYEMHQTIIRWREEIWQYHQRKPEQTEKVFEEAAETMAERLIDLGHHTNLFTLPIESWKLHNLQVSHLDGIEDSLPTKESLS